MNLYGPHHDATIEASVELASIYSSYLDKGKTEEALKLYNNMWVQVKRLLVENTLKQSITGVCLPKGFKEKKKLKKPAN
jgi:pentatricopeptide repeat protein